MRKVLITGASRGIGSSIADKFTSMGYEVFSPSRQEMDLANEESVMAYIEKNRNQYFDVIINNAGINEINLIEDVTDDQQKLMFQVNLLSPIMLLRAFAKSMKNHNYGRIVNIGSIWAVVSKEGRSMYSATKHGLHGITETLALELAPYGVLVNTVCPGYTMTELTKRNNSAETIKQISAEIPLKRMAQPQEIAELVFFLGDEKNTYITGQMLTIDGGYSIK